MNRLTTTIVFIALTGALSVQGASAQAVDCQRLLDALVSSPPGAYSPEQAQDMATVYNQNCLNQQQSQTYYPQQQQQSEQEAFGEALGQFMGGLMRR